MVDSPEEKDPQFAYTLAKGLQVLRAYDAFTPALSNSEIAGRTGLSRQTVVRLTRTLALLGYLRQDVARQRYRLAPSVLLLGYPLLTQLSVRQLARPHMQELANQFHGSSSMAVRSGAQMVLIESCVDAAGSAGKPDIGAPRGMHDTSMGLVYFCSASASEKDEITGQLRALHGRRWPAVRKQLLQAQEQFDRLGYCTASTPLMEIDAVSVPLRASVDGERVVINCSVFRFQSAPDTIDKQVAPRLLHLARSLETTLGMRT